MPIPHDLQIPDAFRELLGKQLPKQLPRDAVHKIRVVEPDRLYTCEYDANRINIRIDQKGIVCDVYRG